MQKSGALIDESPKLGLLGSHLRLNLSDLCSLLVAELSARLQERELRTRRIELCLSRRNLILQNCEGLWPDHLA